jgi:lipoprotein-anchoring transpeptidase ErfK/SrfK
MDRLRPIPPRSPAVLAAVVLLAAAGWTGCGVAKPSPAAPKDQTAAPTPKDPAHLVLRLGERRIYLMDGDPSTPAESFPVAIGKAGWETPTGRFQVEDKVMNPDFLKVDDTVTPMRVIKRIPPGPTNPLGERWIQFAHGEGWTVGLHGTPNPELLGQAVSHGCVRMRNADVIKIYDRVELGTPVIVEQ